MKERRPQIAVPAMLRVAPGMVGLATAGIVVLLASGPLRAERDMSAIYDPVSVWGEPAETGMIKQDEVPLGFEMYCVRDAANRCISRVDKECVLWVRVQSPAGWVIAANVEFHDAGTQVSEPDGARVGSSLMEAGLAVCHERERALAREEVLELESLGAAQAWDEIAKRGTRDEQLALGLTDADRKAIGEVVDRALAALENHRLDELEYLAAQKQYDRVLGGLAQAESEGIVVTQTGVERAQRLEERIEAELRWARAERDVRDYEARIDGDDGLAERLLELERKVPYARSAAGIASIAADATELAKSIGESADEVGKWPAMPGALQVRLITVARRLRDLRQRCERILGQALVDHYARLLRKGSASALRKYEQVAHRCEQTDARARGECQSERTASRRAWKRAARWCSFWAVSTTWDGDAIHVTVIPDCTRGQAKEVTLRFALDYNRNDAWLPQEVWHLEPLP